MKARDIEIGDVVIVHGVRIGKVIDKFTSVTGEKVFDVKLTRGRRVAALGNQIIANLGPRGWSPGSRPTPCW